MAKVTVNTGAGVALDLTGYPDVSDRGQYLLLQNLGTGDVYFDVLSNVTTATGVKIAANGSFLLHFHSSQNVYVTASVNGQDLRYTVVG